MMGTAVHNCPGARGSGQIFSEEGAPGVRPQEALSMPRALTLSLLGATGSWGVLLPVPGLLLLAWQPRAKPARPPRGPPRSSTLALAAEVVPTSAPSWR